MEFVNAVVEIVNQVGFPIACVCAMFWQMEQERKSHAAESAAWVEALNRNSEAINKVMVVVENIMVRLEAMR